MVSSHGRQNLRLLLDGPECAIVASSRASLLVERQVDEGAEILLVRGRELSSLGPSPDEPTAVQPLANGAAFLVSSMQAPSGSELLWLTLNEEPKHFAVEPALSQYNMVLAPEGVALVLEDHTNTFVRLFTETGPEKLALGISNYSTLAYVDERYFWYSWNAAADGLPRFQRARQFELADAIPHE